MHLEEKTLKSEVVYKGKIFEVLKDTALLENDAQAQRDVVKHAGGVGIVPITDDNCVIFVRQFRYPIKEVLLEIPAGKLEWGENHLECAKRELLEETGRTANCMEYLGYLLPTPAYNTEVTHIYLAKDFEIKEQHLDEDEFLEIEKIPLQKAVEMVLNNEITDAKTQIGILKAKLILDR